MTIWAAILSFFAALLNLVRKKQVKEIQAQENEVVNAPRTDDALADKLRGYEQHF
jgi:hypothetical protein